MANERPFLSAGDAAPWVDAQPITVGTAYPNGMARGIYVGVTGNVTLTTKMGTTVTIPNLPVGPFPIQSSIVTAATASSLLALY